MQSHIKIFVFSRFLSDCINSQVDIALVVDVSESIYDVDGNYQLLKEFLAQIIADSDVNSGRFRFALTLFNHDVFNEFYLHTYNTSSAMIQHIQQMPLRSGGTYTGQALANLRTHVFVPPGDRPGADNIAIVLTDGHSFDNALTAQQALQARQVGIKLIAVGIGLHNTSELVQIASEPTNDNVFSVTDFDHLFTLEDVIEARFIGECTGL